MDTTEALPLGRGALARKPGFMQAAVLLVTAGLSVLVTAVLGPSLPLMQEHFKDVPGADYLVPLTMTAPMLTMACLSIFAGALSDRWGRKRMLIIAACLYAAFGTMPMWVDSLNVIIASRVLLGAIEAVLMTVSTTMIGDYYHGAQRGKFMSLQTTISAASAFLLNNLGGLIAEHGWRAPYGVYAISLVLAPAMMVFLWEPVPGHDDEEARAAATRGDAPWRPGLLTFVCALAVLLGIAFLTVPVHFGYLFGAIGVHSPSQIGAAYGLNSLGVIAGTLLFGWVIGPRLPVAFQLAIGCLLAGIGFVLMRTAPDYAALTLAGVVNGVGAGMMLPTMVTWAMRILPFARRGMGTGAFQSCLFFGMFVNPVLIVALEKHFDGSRAAGIGGVGFVLVALAVVAGVTGLRHRD
ncbi:MAG: MFS transporter [Burkholderiales bacterium]|nr:MFS transporter [Burkholderiales bacterium]